MLHKGCVIHAHGQSTIVLRVDIGYNRFPNSGLVSWATSHAAVDAGSDRTASTTAGLEGPFGVEQVARKKTSQSRIQLKTRISDRLREIRQELFGEHGGPELARRLSLPARTWYNYETGVTVPAEILLAFLEQTGINPVWLLTGEGPRSRRGLEAEVIDDLPPQELIRLGLEKLERGASTTTPTEDRWDDGGDFAAVGLVEPDDLANLQGPLRASGTVLIFRRWLARPRSAVAMRLDDDAMAPILTMGSIVAIDRSSRQPSLLEGRIVAARVEGRAVVRWLELSGRHLILRPNRGGSGSPTLALEPPEPGADSGVGPILGQVVWSWGRYD